MDILASLSSGAVGGLFGGIGTLAKDIREAITGDLPADKQAEIQQKLMEIELQASQGQMEINKVEAASSSLFVAGWRPAVGWIGAAGLGYAAIIEPIMTFTATMKGYRRIPCHRYNYYNADSVRYTWAWCFQISREDKRHKMTYYEVCGDEAAWLPKFWVLVDYYGTA